MPAIRCMCGGVIEFKPGDKAGMCPTCGTASWIPKDEKSWGQAKVCRTCRITNLLRPGTKAEVCMYCGTPFESGGKKNKPEAKAPDIDSFDDLILESLAIPYTKKYGVKEGEGSTTEQPIGPVDIFICCEKADPNGEASKNSALGEDIYYHLTRAGYKVFYEGVDSIYRCGMDILSYRNEARRSARVMLVVGTKPESFMADQIKADWEFYLNSMKNSRNKRLIPCYCDMKVGDLPTELLFYQSLNLTEPNSLTLLLQSIEKFMEKKQ